MYSVACSYELTTFSRKKKKRWNLRPTQIFECEYGSLTLRTNSVISVPVLSWHRLRSVPWMNSVRWVDSRGTHRAGMWVWERLEIHRLSGVHFFTETQQMESSIRANFIIHTLKKSTTKEPFKKLEMSKEVYLL